MIMLFRRTSSKNGTGENGSLNQAQVGDEMVPAGHRFNRMAAWLTKF